MTGYGQFCPLAKATELIGEKWTMLILRELFLGTTRFNDFQRALSRMSPTLLANRLRKLEECGSRVRTIIEVWAGDLDIRTARRNGSVKAHGLRHPIRTMPDWFGVSLYTEVRRGEPEADAASH